MSKLKLLLFIISLLCLGDVLSQQGTPPQITVTGNQLYCSESPMNIVTSVSISDPDSSILNEIYIQISQGYTTGQDVLNLTGTHPNITASWSTIEGELTLTGPASLLEFEAAISDVVYQTTETNFTEDKVFSINLGTANFLPSTGHYYFYVPDVGITWTEARDAAASLTYFGLQGYLATITSSEEAELTGEQASGTGWIGGSDEDEEGTWRWKTGPEAGQIFWIGAWDGAPPNDEFTFWNTGEPNNFGDEDYAHITDPSIGVLGSWNDLPNQGDVPESPYHPQGYVVEFGGMPGDPDIMVSASTVIVTPKVEIITETLCDEGLANVEITSNTDVVIWYETPSSADPINTGLSYQANIDSTTTFWLEALFQGCNGGARIPVTVTVFNSPVANDVTIAQCDDEVLDGFSSFNLSNKIQDIIQGTNVDDIPNLDITFYDDDLLSNPISESSYTNVTNPQTVYAEVFNVLTSCTSIAEITLLVNSTAIANTFLETCDDFVVDGFTFFDLSLADNQVLSSAPAGATVGYYETYQEALLETNEIIGEYFNAVQFNQIIYARINTNDNCYAIGEVELSVKAPPNIVDYEEVLYCLNTFPETITLTGGIIDDIPNNYAYEWSTGETTLSIEVNTPGTYTVLVTEPGGCSNLRTIVVIPSSTATIENIEVTDLTENNTISVFVSGEGVYEYALDNENGPYDESNIFENVPPGIHTVYVRDIKNDCGIVSQTVSVIGYPKFFTPNGDDVNDTWSLFGFSTEFRFNANVNIFNRFGKLIYELNASNLSWNGNYNGKLLPADDYWFEAKLEDGRTFSGHFALVR